MMAWIKRGCWCSSWQRLGEVSTRAGECGLFSCCLFIGSDCSLCLNPASKMTFPFPPKHNTNVSGFFFSLLRIFSISYVSGPGDFISAGGVALRKVQKLFAVYVLFFLLPFFSPGLHRMRVRPRCACAPSGVVGDSHRLHLECCKVLDAGVAYQPDTRRFKLASVQKHPN